MHVLVWVLWEANTVRCAQYLIEETPAKDKGRESAAEGRATTGKERKLRKTWPGCIVQSEVSQKEKNKHRISTHVCEILRDGPDEPVCRAAIKTQTQRTDLWNLGRGGGAGRRGWDECREQHGSVRVTTHEIESQWR